MSGADAGRRAPEAERGAAGRASDGAALTEVAELLGADARERILHVKRGLRELSVMLAKAPAATPAQEPAEFELKVAPVPKARKEEVVGPGLRA